ncbi:hypothetical protein CDV36_005907 [Fusarium kuroshium]|uniref:Heterokaryon incompatibility domain-containing protein n=1 Tax=Fusarium kuroshium TaxID=2010991 RepID=A0A3M2SAW2_9HYPO|nr:hypothetical protein CDV36_005907 [Fusarium kuroshium]
MRLLETKSYELFEASDIPAPFPSYAILSHTWISSKDEITYQDMKTRKGDIKNDVYKQKGWSKLRKYCDRAAKDGWEWAWMDTCCIDKTNPADTQEAINAMFRWYQSAGICYAHLEDVDVLRDVKNMDLPQNVDFDGTVGSRNAANPNGPLHKALERFFIKAKWFTRGWTLQELLAPHYLVFVDRAWRRIGTRESWAHEIERASNIEAHHLTSFEPTDFASCSTAMRFSWASGRETTVEEDETYSLLGLFGISLPLIYGEGSRQAFNRLQRQLIIVYNDDSLFSWKEPQAIASKSGWGILARSVKDFWDASKVKALGHYGNTFSMTNQGLAITAKHWRHKADLNAGLIRLNCSFGSDSSQETGIYLTYDADADAYHRIRIHQLCDMSQVNFNDWKEERSREPILIRGNNYSDRLICSSIFSLEYSEPISIVAKYIATFSHSVVKKITQLLDGDSRRSLVQGLQMGELCIEPNRVVFINIELDDEGTRWQFDVIISLSKSCFPRVGILGREREPWERPGDPLGEELDMYEALAGHVQFTPSSDPTYPAVAVETTENLVVGVHLLPKPPRERSRNLRRDNGVREYVLRISVGRRDEESLRRNTRHWSPEEREDTRKRRRIS